MTQAATLAGLASSGALSAASSGNVGIGTTSPAQKFTLQSSGNTYLLIEDTLANGYNAATLYKNDQRQFRVGVLGTVGGFPSGALIVYDETAAAYRMVIDSSGNLLVGRTNNPSGLSNSLYVTGAYSNTTPSGANVFVNTDGSFFRSTSSLKYKTEVQDYSRGLEDVAKLRAVFYKAKSGISTEQRFAGFIAEEIEAAGLTEFVQYNENNEPDALSYGNMVALCIKAIQEQQAMIEELKAKVAALEAR
jgi:hypothetical protein